MKKQFVIEPDGTVYGLWDDALANLGDATVTRASKVEFSDTYKRWTVEILIGRFAGCFLPSMFLRRKDALEAEVKFMNQELDVGQLTPALVFP